MHQPITGFHQDHEQHWVAELACGHNQHVRHEPPLTSRPWVLSEPTRQAHLGSLLDCLLCDQPVIDPYEDARVQGLCPDGAAEAARQRQLPGKESR